MHRAALLVAIFVTFTSSSAFADVVCGNGQAVGIEIGQLVAFGLTAVPTLFAPRTHIRAGLGAAMDDDSYTPVLVATGGRAHGWFRKGAGYGALMQSIGAHQQCSLGISSHLGAGLELHKALDARATLYGMLGPQVSFADERLVPGAAVAVGVLYDGAIGMSAELRYLPTVTREQLVRPGGAPGSTPAPGLAVFEHHLQHVSAAVVHINPNWTWSPFLEARLGFDISTEYVELTAYGAMTAGLAYHR